MQRPGMTQKPVGQGMYKGGVKKKGKGKEQAEAKKVPVWVPELGLTMYVLPGEDVNAKVAKYMEQREFGKGRLKGKGC
jgi:hypothetical protein